MTVIEARHLSTVRRATAALVAPGKRLHFHEELDSMRRSVEVFVEIDSDPERFDGVAFQGYEDRKSTDQHTGTYVLALGFGLGFRIRLVHYAHR